MRPKLPPLVVPYWDPTQGVSEEVDQFQAQDYLRNVVLEDHREQPAEMEDLSSIEADQGVPGFDFDVTHNPPNYENASIYTPLLPGQIRLFRLEARNIFHSQDSNQIVVRGVLELHLLANHPQYNALSYCWGSNANPRPISVNGRVIWVHHNLEAALRKIQSFRGDMLLWADRLCINQNDDEEKTQQVQLMKDIYTKASIAFAWLGESADDSDLIMDHIRVIGEDIFPGSRGMLETEGQLDQILLPHKTLDSRRKLSNAFKFFCQRPYWQRLWVIQEFALAQEVVIICGERRVTYEQLLTAVYFIQQPRYYFETTNALIKTVAPAAIAETIETIVGTYWAATPSFMQSVVTFRVRHREMEFREEDHFFRVLVTSLAMELDYNQPKSTDPRDRIFATLGLASNAEEFPMLPDYQHDWQYVYTEFTKALLRQGHIDILSFCQFTDINPRLLKNEILPSWVPDWNLKIKYPCVGSPWATYFKASRYGPEVQKVQFDEDQKQVSLLGTTVDTISSIGNLWDPDWLAPFDIKAAQNYISEIEQLCRQSSHPSITDSNLNEVVGRTCIADKVCCDGSRTFWQDEEVYPDGYCQCYLDTRSSLEKGCLPNNIMYCEGLKFLHSRRPFISEAGLVGLAPSNVEIGDEICIFFGGKTPYTISESKDGVSRLKGETFVHGIMYGGFWEMYPNPDLRWIVLS